MVIIEEGCFIFPQEFYTAFFITTYCLQVMRHSIGALEFIFSDGYPVEDAISVQILDDFPDSNVIDDADDFLLDVRYVIALVIINEVERVSYL